MVTPVTRDNSMVRQRGNNKTPAQKGSEKLVKPDDEQWRLVNESGLLKTINATSPKLLTEEPDEYSLVDEVFDAALLIIPFSFLLFMMDMSVSCQSLVSLCLIFHVSSLIHYQYAKEPPFLELGGRLSTRVPSKV